MKERPIIFTGESPSLILAGHKTMTRRTTGLSGVNDTPKTNPKLAGETDSWMYGGPDVWEIDTVVRPGHVEFRRKKDPEKPFERDVIMVARCPYGVPGDRLWVKEGFALSIHDPATVEPDIKNPNDWDAPRYRSGYEGGGEWWRQEIGPDGYARNVEKIPVPWRSSIYMPRWASRIDLLIKDIRLERLYELDGPASEAEGVLYRSSEEIAKWGWPQDGPNWFVGGTGYYTNTEAFAYGLWNPANEKRGYPFHGNWWTWAIEFELIDKSS